MKKSVFILSFLLLFGLNVMGNTGSRIVLSLEYIEEKQDPNNAVDSFSRNFLSLLHEGLFRKNKNGEVVPGLVKNWKVSSDGLKWTFYLKDNIKWSNGDIITAEDFKRSWLRVLNPGKNFEWAFLLYPIKNAEKYNRGAVTENQLGIKIINSKTIEVELEKVIPYLPDILSRTFTVPVHKNFENQKDKYYSGAYIVKGFENRDIVLEKNKDYWESTAVKINTVVIKEIYDEDSKIRAFENKEIDITAISGEKVSGYKGTGLQTIPDGSVWYLTLNTKNKVLSNPKIRKSLQIGINRDNLIREAINGTGLKPFTFVPNNIGIKGISGDFSREVTTKIPDYNKEEAKRLLSEGLKDLGITKMPSFTLIYNNSGNNEKVVKYIQKNLKENLNIDIKLSSVSFPERIKRQKNRNFEIVFAGWSGDYNNPETYLNLFYSGSLNNSGSFSNAEYERLFKITESTVNNNERIKAFKEMERIISQEIPVVTLFNRNSYYLVNPKIKGVGFASLENIILLREAEITR